MEDPPSLFTELMHVIARLRGPDGCPWDRKQTARTMARYLQEELYELLEAVEAGEPGRIQEELGDLLFHIFFIAQTFEEQGAFDIGDVVAGITQKMIHRHPHVFGEHRLSDPEAVRAQWHEIKMAEKKATPNPASLLDSVPKKMPALLRAYQISERAGRMGFDWPDIDGVMEKAREEWAELEAELAGTNGDQPSEEAVALEFGDLIFTLVNVARFARIHPETALSAAIGKFEKRFRHMEQSARKNKEPLESASPARLDGLWEQAKKKTRKKESE